MFKKAYIPRTLTEVKNYERDVDIMMKLKEEDLALCVQQDNVSVCTCVWCRVLNLVSYLQFSG